MKCHIRLARPSQDPSLVARMYCDGLGFQVLGTFTDHDGFDGVMVGDSGMGYHLEFTRHRSEPVIPTPTPEDLLVFYLPDKSHWLASEQRLVKAGFQRTSSHNPYWEKCGSTWIDIDSYRLVLQNADWN